MSHTHEMRHKVSKKHFTPWEVNRGSLYCGAEVEIQTAVTVNTFFCYSIVNKVLFKRFDIRLWSGTH